MADLVKYQEDARNYLNSLNLLKTMQKLGILSDLEFKKAEKTLAKKYCIKTNSIYRLYGLNS